MPLLSTAKLFVSGLSLQWKLAGAGVLIALMGYVVIQYGNRQYYQGVTAGENSLIEEVNENITEENRIERTRLLQERGLLDQAWATLADERGVFEARRDSDRQMFEQAQADIQTLIREETIRVAEIPDSELNGAIRAELEHALVGGSTGTSR